MFGFEIERDRFLIGMLLLVFLLAWISSFMAYKFAVGELLQEFGMVFFSALLYGTILFLGLGWLSISFAGGNLGNVIDAILVR